MVFVGVYGWLESLSGLPVHVAMEGAKANG